MTRKMCQYGLIAGLGLAGLGLVLSASAQEEKKGPAPVTIQKVPGGTISIKPVEKSKAPAQDPSKIWAFLPEVIATIGTQKISKQQLLEEIKNEFPTKYQSLDEAGAKEFAKEMVTGMVDKTVLLDLAKKDNIIPSADLVKTGFDDMLKNLPPTEKTFFLKQLEMKKTSLEAYKDKISKDKKSQDAFAINQWIKKNIEPKLKIGDAEVKKYYDEHKDFFKKPETIQASHILIKAESEKPEDLAKAKKKADELLARLKKGEDFAELAKKESACPSGAKGGDLGEFARGTMVPQFEQVAFTLKPGELSNVVETKFGCHLIKGGQKNEGKTYELDDKVKKYIEMRLKSEKEVQELEKTLKAEKDKLGVKLEI